MKNVKLPIALLLAGCFAFAPWWSHAQQPRGQGVRIKVENGQELDLYDESHALVIGVSDYNGGWRKLPGVKRDVAEVAVVLERQGFKVTRLLDPTIEDFERAMRNFISAAGLRERNRLVVYFAGHGHTERLSDERDLGYIVMRNAPKPDLDPALFSQAAISMEQVNAWAQRIKSKHALFVFDSCFSGSIFRSEPEKRRPARIESKSAGPVRQFITSGNAGQEVPDDSIFRRYFVRAFDGEGDLDGDGYLTGEELGIFLSGRVASDTGDTQTPRYGKIRDARLNLGDFVFALPKKAAPPPPVPTPAPPPSLDPAALELALWQSADRSNELSEYEEYLRQYPQGRFAVSARNRIARLRAPAANPPPAAPKPTPTPAPQPFTDKLNNRVPLEMVAVPGGSFLMGSPDGEGSNDEHPQHPVIVPSFFIGKYEVTQAQWRAVMNTNPSNFKGDDLPVENVSWNDAQEFCRKLSALTGKTYRLPTEAEWEYACRAGTTGDYSGNLDAMAWHGNNSGGKTHPVGGKQLNAFGLYDMHGNVWEWCEDVWHDSYNGNPPTDGSAWLSGGDSSYRVLRGGSFDLIGYCRSALRNRNGPGDRGLDNGFRVALSARTQ